MGFHFDPMVKKIEIGNLGWGRTISLLKPVEQVIFSWQDWHG
jgi:hypothetical protein